MSERPSLPQEATPRPTWDPDILGAALDATVTPTRDLALGDGHRLTLRSRQPTYLDVTVHSCGDRV